MKPYSKCPVMRLLVLALGLLSRAMSEMSTFILTMRTQYSPLIIKSGSMSTVFVNLLQGGSVRESTRTISGHPSLDLSWPSHPVLQLGVEDETVAKLVQISPAELDLLHSWQNSTAELDSSVQQMPASERPSVVLLNLESVAPNLDGNLFNASFSISGEFLGRTRLYVMAWNLEPKAGGVRRTPLIEKPVFSRITVLNGNALLNHIFVGVLTILMIIANLLMGSQLHLPVIWSVVRRPFAPAIGFICQFLLMPVIAYCLALAIFVPCGFQALALGLFTVGCSPGGGASNIWTVLLGGNVDLSVTMTFLSTVLALVLMPIWMFTVGQQFMTWDHSTGSVTMESFGNATGQNVTSYTDDMHLNIRIPYWSICISLLVLVLPLLVGILLRRFWPFLADIAKCALRPFICLIIVFICSFGVYANLYMFRLMTWRVLVAGIMLPWFGFLFGVLVATVLRQPRANVIAIAVETGIQNSGIAIMLLKGSFPAPDGDLASVVPVMVSIFTPVPLVGALALILLKKWMNGGSTTLSVGDSESPPANFSPENRRKTFGQQACGIVVCSEEPAKEEIEMLHNSSEIITQA